MNHTAENSTSSHRLTGCTHFLAALAALVCLLAAAPATFAKVTATFDSATGELRVESDADDAITITVAPGGCVLVNGEFVIIGGSSTLKPADVKQIFVYGGPGGNAIDLSGVTRTAFPNITSNMPPTLSGGDDHVSIEGRGGADTITGSEYNDLITGGDDNDTIDGGPGSNQLQGGDGDDVIWHNGEGAVWGDAGNDTIIGFLFDGLSEGGTGDDTFTLDDVAPGSGAQGEPGTLSDEGGRDTLNLLNAGSGITLDMDLTDEDQTIDAAGNMVHIQSSQLENFVGSPFDDVVTVKALDVPRHIDGGDGLGDTLNFDAQGAKVTDDGTTLTVAGYESVAYTNFETVNIVNFSDIDDADLTDDADDCEKGFCGQCLASAGMMTVVGMCGMKWRRRRK